VAVQWLRALASSRAIDFTDRDFARGQPQARAAATVSRCLHLHAEHGPPLELFRVALLVSPTGSDDDGAFGPGEVTGWVAAAVARGTRDVEVDLTRGREDPADNDGHGYSAFVVELPGDLFLPRHSLERLALAAGSASTLSRPARPGSRASTHSSSATPTSLTRRFRPWSPTAGRWSSSA
jgi:hypothetical protein